MAGKGLQSGDPLPGVAGHRPAWFDPALPAREDCVLRDLLDSRAQRCPDRICARFEDGSTLTYAECRASVSFKNRDSTLGETRRKISPPCASCREAQPTHD